MSDLEFAAAWWCTHPGEIERATTMVTGEVMRQAIEAGVAVKPIVYEMKALGDDGCPDAPDWLLPAADPRCLIARAEPYEELPPVSVAGASFLTDMSDSELRHLRKVTRAIGRKNGHATMTDADVDAVISRAGPKAAEAMLSQRITEGNA